MLLGKKHALFVTSIFPLKLSSGHLSCIEFVLNYSKRNMQEKVQAVTQEIEFRHLENKYIIKF